MEGQGILDGTPDLRIALPFSQVLQKRRGGAISFLWRCVDEAFFQMSVQCPIAGKGSRSLATCLEPNAAIMGGLPTLGPFTPSFSGFPPHKNP